MLGRLLMFALIAALIWRFIQKTAAPKPDTRPRDPAAPNKAAGSDPWSVLGVARGSTPEAIRAAYQAKVRQYHPDQVANLGPELRDLAEAKTKEINAAYEQLKR